MPITIWEPQRYKAGFPINTSGANTFSAAANPPYDKPTKACEIVRFSGYKTKYYANTGEMEIAISAGQVEPQNIQIGYWVDIDGDNYRIESVSWERSSMGYECVIAGRDACAMLDKYIQNMAQAIGGSFNSGALNNDNPQPLQLVTVKRLLNFAFGVTYTYGGSNSIAANWLRNGSTYVTTDYEVEPAASAGSDLVTDILSFGAQLRIFCSWFGIGYSVDLALNSYGYMWTYPKLYNRADNGIIINADGRGVSNFKYEKDSRNIVNSCNASAVSKWLTAAHPAAAEKIYMRNELVYGHGAAVNINWSDVENNWSGMFLDLGEVPDENDTTYTASKAWIRQQAQLKISTKFADESISFNYDNTGAYKYGEHFFLGSPVTVKDDYLGVSAKQTLTMVRTNYEAGDTKGYSFEFGDQRITQADKLKEKFSSIDMRTYKARTEQ